jgi:hypothetical protein
VLRETADKNEPRVISRLFASIKLSCDFVAYARVRAVARGAPTRSLRALCERRPGCHSPGAAPLRVRNASTRFSIQIAHFSSHLSAFSIIEKSRVKRADTVRFRAMRAI